MRRAWWILLAVPVLLNFQLRRADLSGTWTLDLAKSVNLAKEFKTVDSYSIDIRQSGDSLTVVATMKGGGQTVPFPPYVYLVNGKENYRLDTVRGSERWATAKWGADGKSIVMDTRVKLRPPGRSPMEFTQHDVWKLANDSTIDVVITQKIGGVDSTRTEERIFRKQR